MTGSNSFSDMFLQAAKWDISACIQRETKILFAFGEGKRFSIQYWKFWKTTTNQKRMLDVKCCSDRIKPPQNLSSASRSLYNKTASGAISPEGDVPPLLTQESNSNPALCTREHQKLQQENVQLLQHPPPSFGLCWEATSIPHSQIWKTHLSDTVGGSAKLFRQATMEKSTKYLATGQGVERDVHREYPTVLPPP